MKQFIINLGLVYLGGFMFFMAVMMWFNRPTLRHQLAVLNDLNDGNVAYSNALNAQIRDLTDMNNACYLDAVEKDNLISVYDEALKEKREEVEFHLKHISDWAAAKETLQSKYNKLVEINQKDFDTITDMRQRLAEAHAETGKQRKQVEHHLLTIQEYNTLLNDSHVAILGAQDEVRKATETIEFLKSELVMAERQLERLS